MSAFLAHPLVVALVSVLAAGFLTGATAWARNTTTTLKGIEQCVAELAKDKAAKDAATATELANVEKHQAVQDSRLDRLDAAVFVVAVQQHVDRQQ